MDILVITFSLLIQAAIVGGIGFGIYALVRRGRRNRDDDSPEPEDAGVGTPRRFYFYSISFIATIVAANGVMITLMSLLDALFGGDMLLDSPAQLATGLSMTIVGIPLWAVHWRWVQSAVASNDVERRSILRHLHLRVVSGVALAFIGLSAYLIIEYVLGAADFGALPWAALPVWGLVWYYHRLMAASDEPFEIPETRAIRRLYLYLASIIGVAAFASGVGWLIYIILQEGYLAAFAVSLADAGGAGIWRDSTAQAISLAVAGGAVWASHWLWFARDDRDSALRWIYLYVAAVGFGAIATLTALGIFIATVIRWPFGVTDVSDHFEELPAAVAALAAAGAVWVYHRHRMKVEAASSLDAVPIARIHDCLLAAIGLIAFASASVTIFTLIITELSLIGSVAIGDVPDGYLWDTVSLALTLLLIGAPVWWMHWTRLQSAAKADPETERPALPRKLYVMGALCIAVLALVGGASFTLFVFLRDLLDAALSQETLRELSGGLAVLLTIALFVPYHWNIYREDRLYDPDDAPDTPPIARKRVTLLTAPGGEGAARQIEDALGYPVGIAVWRDPDAVAAALDEAQLSALPERIAQSLGANVVLVPEADGLRIISHG